MDEGYVKFNCIWIKDNPLERKKFDEMNKWRQKLYHLDLIGMYPNGIGFGNLSIREGNSFIITGSKTGNLPSLNKNHYVRVVDFNLKANSVTCRGPITASSESLTHAIFYKIDSAVKAVIHVHQKDSWRKLMDKVPTSSRDVPYGTPEMAREVLRLYRESDIRNKRILVMAGHEDGIISFGTNLEEAGKTLLSYL